MVDVYYAPGTAHVVVTGATVVVIDGDVSTDLLASIWRSVDTERGVAAVLQALSGAFGTSLSAIPPFVVAVAEPHGIRIAIRGRISATVRGGDAPVRLTGEGVTTWLEQVVTGATRTEIGVQSEVSDDARLPLRDGVALAAALVVEWQKDAAAGVGGIAEASAPVTAVVEPDDGDAPLDTWSSDATLVPELTDRDAGDDPATPRNGVVLVDSLPDFAAATKTESEQTAEPESEQTAEPEHEAEPESAAEPAAPVESVAAAESDREPEPATGREAESESAQDPAPSAAASAPSPTGGDVLDTVASVRGDHDGETLSVSQMHALRGEGSEADTSAEDDAPAPLAPPRMPAPGRLRMSTGQEVPLDRTVVVGRRPRSTRVTGTDLPRLVAVDSPDQDISRSHLELRVEGDSILATDLHSTNGTTLRRVGAEPVRLHPGERNVVVPGDVLDLGDGVTVAVEAIA